MEVLSSLHDTCVHPERLKSNSRVWWWYVASLLRLVLLLVLVIDCRRVHIGNALILRRLVLEGGAREMASIAPSAGYDSDVHSTLRMCCRLWHRKCQPVAELPARVRRRPVCALF
jgi:hypothetical protein